MLENSITVYKPEIEERKSSLELQLRSLSGYPSYIGHNQKHDEFRRANAGS
jgi:hypothetical protein